MKISGLLHQGNRRVGQLEASYNNCFYRSCRGGDEISIVSSGTVNFRATERIHAGKG
jgi:hypothetical protein